MNQETVRKFCGKVKKNRNFARKAAEFNQQVTELTRFARDAGLDFNEDEIVKAAKSLEEKRQEECRCKAESRRHSCKEPANEQPASCPVCGEKLLFEETGARSRWRCFCGKYERIAMNEWQPNRYILPLQARIRHCPKKCTTEMFRTDRI